MKAGALVHALVACAHPTALVLVATPPNIRGEGVQVCNDCGARRGVRVQGARMGIVEDWKKLPLIATAAADGVEVAPRFEGQSVRATEVPIDGERWEHVHVERCAAGVAVHIREKGGDRTAEALSPSCARAFGLAMLAEAEAAGVEAAYATKLDAVRAQAEPETMGTLIAGAVREVGEMFRPLVTLAVRAGQREEGPSFPGVCANGTDIVIELRGLHASASMVVHALPGSEAYVELLAQLRREVASAEVVLKAIERGELVVHERRIEEAP